MKDGPIRLCGGRVKATFVSGLVATLGLAGATLAHSGDFVPRLTVTAERYGARGDGITDDTVAIRRAQAALDAAGGGTLKFARRKTYLLATVSTATVRVPVATAAFGPANESHQYHVLIRNEGNIRWNLNGSTLKSTVSGGGEMFILDGARNFEVANGTIQSVTAKSRAGTVTNAGMNGFGITSQTRDSYELRFENIVATNVYVPVYIFGDASSTFRVRGVTIDRLRHTHGIYTLACHDNGDEVSARGVRSIDTLREYFVFGVADHDVWIYSEGGTAGFGSIVKAYDRDTTRIKYKLRTKKNISAANVSLQSQHAPAVQPQPSRLIDIELDIDNRGVSGTGVAADFSYYRNRTLAATSTENLWTGIKLRGVHEQPPQVATMQDAPGAAGTLDASELIVRNGSVRGLFKDTGLIDSRLLESAVKLML